MPLANPAHQKLLETLDAIFATLNHFTARMVATLAEVETESIHIELGYTSLIEFCMKRYGMTLEQARLRVGVARLVMRYPQLLQALETGAVTMSNLSLMRNMVKESNVDTLLALVSKTTKEEAKERLAEYAPKPPKESSLKKSRKSAETGLPRRPTIEPTASDEYELVLRIGRGFRDLIQEMRERTHRTNPTGDLTTLTLMAYEALQEKLNKQQYKATDKPAAKPRRSGDPTYITAAVKRAVVERDGGRCTFVGAEGNRCAARGKLQFDHIDLRCRGGLGSVENVRLRCDVHNLHGAKKALGKMFVAKKIAAARAERDAKAKATAETPEAVNGEVSVSSPPKPVGAATPKPRLPTAQTSHASRADAAKPTARSSGHRCRVPNGKASVQTRSKRPKSRGRAAGTG